MTGEEVRAGEDDQRQGDPKRGTHYDWADTRIEIRPDAENQNNSEPNIGPRHHRADPEADRRAPQKRGLRGCYRGKLIDGLEKHLLLRFSRRFLRSGR